MFWFPMIINEYTAEFQSTKTSKDAKCKQCLYLSPPPPCYEQNRCAECTLQHLKAWSHSARYTTKILWCIINNYWMRSSRIWGIIKTEDCVTCRSRRLRQITQTEALIIPYILREPNSIIVLLFICICEPFPWRSHLCFEFWHKQHKPFVFCIWHKQHKLVWRHKVV